MRTSRTSSRPRTAPTHSSSGSSTGRSLRECTAMSISDARSERLDALGEDPVAADFRQGAVDDVVSPGFDGHDVALDAAAAKERRHLLRLPEGKTRRAGAQAEPLGRWGRQGCDFLGPRRAPGAPRRKPPRGRCRPRRAAAWQGRAAAGRPARWPGPPPGTRSAHPGAGSCARVLSSTSPRIAAAFRHSPPMTGRRASSVIFSLSTARSSLDQPLGPQAISGRGGRLAVRP